MNYKNKKPVVQGKDIFSEQRGLNIPTQSNVPPMPEVKPMPTTQSENPKK